MSHPIAQAKSPAQAGKSIPAGPEGGDIDDPPSTILNNVTPLVLPAPWATADIE